MTTKTKRPPQGTEMTLTAADVDRLESVRDPEVQEFRKGFDSPPSHKGTKARRNVLGEPIATREEMQALGISDGTNVPKNGATRAGAVKPPTSKEAHRPPNGVSFVAMQIPVGEIRPFEFQARQSFDEGYLAELAASIKKLGQLQEAVVRRRPSESDPKRPYELVIGECRWRACKLAGEHHLRAREVDVTDEEAIEMNGFENVKRKNLNPIEEARWLKLMMDRCGYTQESLAARFRAEAGASASGEGGKGRQAKTGPKSKVQGPKSQGAVSNKLRLLELPANLQAAVADGRLSESHGIVLVPHVRNPGFADSFLKYAAKQKWLIESLEHFDCDIERTYGDCAERISWKAAERKFAQEHAEEIGLFVWKSDSYGEQWLATKPKRWAELLEAWCEKAEAKQEKRKSQKRRKLSPAEAKKRHAQLAEQHLARVNRWYVAWLQRRIAARLEKPDRDGLGFIVGKLLLFFAVRDSHTRDLSDVREVSAAMETGLPRKRSRGKSKWEQLSSWIDEPRAAFVGYGCLRRWITQPIDTYRAHLREEDVRAIGREMSIDVSKEWVLEEGFLTLFTKDQLFELAKEWKLAGAENAENWQAAKRQKAIAEILDVARNRRLPTPAILLELAKRKD